MPGGQSQLLLCQGVAVVAAPLYDAVNQLVTCLRNVCYLVARPLERVQHQDRRVGRVQPHRVADAGVLGRVIAEDDRNLFFRVGLQCQVGLLDG